jgi:hypothetical protein
MDQLPGILFISSLAFFLPVAAARFGVGAGWRVIAITCVIWYGFLALAFGVFLGGDRAGWSLLAATMFSLIAVPIIAAVLKVWNWLGRSNAGVAATGPSPPLMQRLPLSLLSPAQWSAIALLLTGGFLGSYWYERRDLNARAGIVGRFLGLPDRTGFASFQSSNSPATAPRIAAIVRFTKPQFDSFVAQLDQAPLWQHGTPHYDGAPVEVGSPETIKWRDGPLVERAGSTFVRWNKLSAEEMTRFRRGRVLCIALQRKPGSYRSTHSSDAPRYVAKDCSEPAQTERVSRIVLGALDFDTRTLHMIMK